MGIITVLLVFFIRFKQGRIRKAHCKLLKCYTKVRNDDNFLSPVTYIIILGRTAFPKINIFPQRRPLLTKDPQASQQAFCDEGIWCQESVTPWVESISKCQQEVGAGSSCPSPAPSSQLGGCRGLATQGLRLTYSISWNNHFTTTERLLFKKLRPLIKTIHQGSFPPWNLWAP